MSVWQEVGERVFVARYAFYDQDIGAVLTEVGPVLIDTRSTHGQAEELRRDLRELTDQSVAAVIDTHRHHDHCFGNHVFRPAPIWGHARCRSGLIETGEAQRVGAARARPDIAADLAEVVIDPPDRIFEERAVVDIGERRLDLRYLGRAHTDGDIVVLVTGTGVLFAGDILENGAPPWFGDGFPLDWPETASRLLELVTGPVVPGHGDVADRSFVEDQLATFIAVAELGRRVHRGELTVEDALPNGPYGPVASREPIERALAQLRGDLEAS